ncbi:protein of unknown function (plasmid) [Candidatus Methylocalor cossyra]|uniref:Uncharacterized protein n=1 Tax=Candidatus Methylocalor cossyra TaxID=3108543 RepID=A0ABM9NMW3_9GAMM
MRAMLVGYKAVIRGITAPASLKRIQKGNGLPSISRYPGHNCPGLIEARYSRM